MSILLPHVMAYNLDACRDSYGKLLLFLAGPEIYVQTPEQERRQAAAEWVKAFVASFHESCGLPLTLRDTGRVQMSDLEDVARSAISDGAMIVNPKAAGVDEILDILRKAW